MVRKRPSNAAVLNSAVRRRSFILRRPSAFVRQFVSRSDVTPLTDRILIWACESLGIHPPTDFELPPFLLKPPVLVQTQFPQSFCTGTHTAIILDPFPTPPLGLTAAVDCLHLPSSARLFTLLVAPLPLRLYRAVLADITVFTALRSRHSHRRRADATVSTAPCL